MWQVAFSSKQRVVERSARSGRRARSPSTSATSPSRDAPSSSSSSRRTTSAPASALTSTTRPPEKRSSSPRTARAAQGSGTGRAHHALGAAPVGRGEHLLGRHVHDRRGAGPELAPALHQGARQCRPTRGRCPGRGSGSRRSGRSSSAWPAPVEGVECASQAATGSGSSSRTAWPRPPTAARRPARRSTASAQPGRRTARRSYQYIVFSRVPVGRITWCDRHRVEPTRRPSRSPSSVGVRVAARPDVCAAVPGLEPRGALVEPRRRVDSESWGACSSRARLTCGSQYQTST